VLLPAEKAYTLIDQKKSFPKVRLTRPFVLFPFIFEMIGSPKSIEDRFPCKPFIEIENVCEVIEPYF
jgi:hypothetical protein